MCCLLKLPTSEHENLFFVLLWSFLPFPLHRQANCAACCPHITATCLHEHQSQDPREKEQAADWEDPLTYRFPGNSSKNALQPCDCLRMLPRATEAASGVQQRRIIWEGFHFQIAGALGHIFVFIKGL